MKNSVIYVLLLLCLAACAPYLYGVPQENWNRMSEPERIEAMRVYERNEQARRYADQERARNRAIDEQMRLQAAEERARHEAREREWHEHMEAVNRGDGAYGKSIRENNRPVPMALTGLFIVGKTLRWETDAQGGQNGTFHVTATKGPYFYLDQKNYKNRDAGIVKLEGKIKDGKVFINNNKWNESWIGTLNNRTVSGKINNKYSFRISE